MIANSAMSSVPLLPKVAITGLGLVTPLGTSKESFFAGLADGRSALALHSDLSSALPGTLAGQPVWAGRVSEFGAQAAIDAGKRRRMPRLAQMCIVAAREALGLPPGAGPSDASAIRAYGANRLGVVLGTGLGGLDATIEFTRSFIDGGMAAASPAVFPYTVMNASAGLLAIELGLTGPNVTVNHRELSLPEAIAAGAELLQTGRADAVLCGGCDELAPWSLHGQWQLAALASDLMTAQAAPIHPYEGGNKGVVPGEGSVVVLLERTDRAPSAPPLAYLSGWGRIGDDRHRIGWPRVSASDQRVTAGAAASIKQSLAMAGLRPNQLDWVAGAGNGSGLDELETQTLRAGLEAAAEQVAISSVIGQCGEWQTSAGARLGAALFSLSAQRVPGTTHCRTPDSAHSLPGLILHPQQARVDHVLLPTLSQGGGNISLVLSKA